FFFQAEDGIRDRNVTGVQTCALPIFVQQHFWNNAQDVLHQFDDNHPQKVMSIAPNLSSTASSISTVVVRFPPKPTIHIAFDQSYQHPIDKITMQTFGTAVIDHILHHIVHKVLVAYGFEKPFDCKTMPSHILSWQQSVLRSSLHHNTQLLNASIYYQTSFSHIHN